jgi:hypothetical protein
MGNVPSLGSTPEARKAAKAKLSEPKTRSRSVSNLGAEPDIFGKFPKDYQGGLRRSKLHRNMHRLKLANNKTKRVRSLKNRTLKVRR